MKINPGVVVNGRSYEVPGWMYVLAFALRGIAWAVEEADKPEFRKMVNNYLVEVQMEELQAEVDAKLHEINELKKKLR